ncbi:hypothetical protein, partial [Sphaerochaeta sp. S2]|uniref:hypothetical protein n=1 Tax=Sphaerochaeta sp. S2 TaxID=2798868 RepID=UPI0018E918B5
MFNFTIQYDEKKWLEMEEQIHNVYSNHPDPRSAEAAYSVSNIISDAFPNINKKEAMRNSQKIIKNFTGYELDTQNFMTEFVNTMKAQKSDLDVSMTFSKAMLEAQRSGVDSEAYKQKIHEAIEEMNSQKLPYRNDFKDMSLFTDLLVESGRIVPSMIPTMGMYIAGGALSTVTGGASLLAAKTGSSIYSGMMEAGSVAKDLFQVKDEEGNRLSDEYILSAWSLTMAGVGALNLVTDGFEKVTGGIANKLAGKIFSKQATKELVKSGAVKKWGQRIATDYLGKGIAGEAAEEAIEELIGMASSNYIMKHSNETEGTLFEGHSKQDIIKAMAQTAVSTAKGMILTGLPSATVSTIQEYNASDTALKRNANRFSEFNENSAAVSIDTIKVPSGVKETDVKKASEPIKVIQIGDLFKPLDEAHAGLVAGLKKKGAKALNVEVAETSSEFTKESVQSARSFARANNAVEKNGVVVFGDTETMQKKARDYALNQKSVVGYHENENEIIIDREEDGITHSLILRTEEGVKEAVQSEPVPSTPEPTEAVLDENEETTQEAEPEPTESELYEEEALLNEEEMSLDKQETVEPEQVVKKQYTHYNRTLQRKGAKPEEMDFLNKTILPQIHDTIKQQAPNMTEEEAYKLSIPSTYFAFVASKVAKTDVNTFFNENFNAQPFIALSMEQESDFLNSQEGIASAEVQIGNAKPLLNGLTYRKGNKHQIGLAKGFTPTTVVHEMGHVLVNVIKDTEQFAPFLNVYASQLEQDGGSIGTHFQEAFAKDLEQYFIDGKIRDSSLGTIFKEIGQAIRDFLGLISPQLDRETRIAFDRLLDFKLEQESKAEQEPTVEATKAPQLQLDLFGEPSEVVETLAKISNRGYWIEASIRTRPVDNAHTLLRSVPDITTSASEQNIQGTNQIVNKQEYESDQVLASISRDVDLDTTKRSLENHYYVPDSTLKALEGDPDVDWEIQFRRIMLQDPTLFKTFQRALKTVEDGLSGEQEVTAEAVLKVLEENQSEETFTAMKDEVRNPERFVERLIWQSRFEGAKKADRKFSRKLADREYLLEVVRTLLKNIDMGSIHNDLPTEFYSLDVAVAEGKDTEYRYKEARKAIRNDLRRYRRDFYKHKGMLPQLSYEKTVEGTYLDEGIEVEAFGNEELRKLLEAKDTDPVVKEMIRKNLATGDVVETLVNTTREQISQLEADLMGTEAELQETSDALVNKTGELEAVEKNVGKLEDKYHNLQKTNKKNYEHGRMTERKLKTREKYINAMKLKQIIERTNKTIKNIASSKSNSNDSEIMDRLNKTVEILYASTGEELSAEFEARKIGIRDIPYQLQPFFEFIDDRVYAQNPAKGMDIRTLVALRNAVADVRSEAKYERTMRNEALKRDTFKLANDYLATNNNKSFKNIDDFREFMAQEKLKGKADKEGNKALSFFERNFITMNRLMDKLDPAQKTLKPYIFGGYDGNGVFHRGIEGVLDDEKRGEYNRYQAAKQVMKDLKIDQDSLLMKHVSIDVDTETNKRGKEKAVKRDFTLEEAIGIYIYSKQPDAMEKLTSPDGNKLVIERDKDGNIIRNDVETVINSLTDEHKKFGDWLMNDMGGRYNEVANVYYKINNKSLEKIANYFPLIRTGEHIAFSDLMEDQYLNMQENPEDSMTRKRTGGDYPLQLNALSIWNKMVSRQEHYIAGAEFFHQTNWLMHKNGGDMYNLIAMNAGKDYATALQDFLNRVANKRYIYDDADTMINRIRANMVVARLGFNILTMAKQIPALGLIAMEFGPKRLFEAITHMTTDYKGTSGYVYDKAPQMRGHSVSIDFSSFAQLEAKTPMGRKVKKLGEAGMTPIQFIDGFIKNTLWYGAYQNNLETMTEEQAAMEATRWINETQPGGTTKDTAAIYDTNST